MDVPRRQAHTGPMWPRGKLAVAPVDSYDAPDGRDRCSQARRLYESNQNLFEDEADARSALGLDLPVQR